jgi:sugar O-acyltransferase (sialic acid O-acetyltransferase NeuD family)
LNKKIAIYGAGGLGREVAWMLREMKSRDSFEVLGFFDDGKSKNSVVDGMPVLGGLSEINASDGSFQIVLAISDPSTKRRLVQSITNSKVEFPVIIHPTCQPGDATTNRFGKGTILTAGVILTTGITLGDFVLVNLSTTIGHDVRIGSFSTVMPGCSISGNVVLGENTLMGTGARTLQNISVGKNSVIGAGALVTKNFEDGVKLLGVPAAATKTPRH